MENKCMATLLDDYKVTIFTQEKAYKMLKKMQKIIMDNVQNGNMEFKNGKVIGIDGKKISYNVHGVEHEIESLDAFLEAYSGLEGYIEFPGTRQRKFVMVKNGDIESLCMLNAPDWIDDTLYPVMVIDDWTKETDRSITTAEAFNKKYKGRMMEPGEYEFLIMTKMREQPEWSHKVYYSMLETPEDVVSFLAGTEYDDEYLKYRIVNEFYGNPSTARSDSYYAKFKSIKEIAEEHGIDYDAACLKKSVVSEDLPKISMKEIKEAIEGHEKAAKSYDEK